MEISLNHSLILTGEPHSLFDFTLNSMFRTTMVDVVSGLQRLDPCGSGVKVPVTVEDAVKIVEDLTRIH